MVTLKNLSKKFGNNLVLDNINFEIKQGEIVGLLGPNGAGKTTTMRIITGFLNSTSGVALINNEDINDAKKSVQLKKLIGYLPENNPLYYEMFVFEYLRMMANLKQIAKNKIDEEVKKAVKKTGIESIYYKPISELSKGFKQRVGLAASILGNPKILILDEPTEGLDPNQRIDIRNLIKNLGQDKTVIISSHVLTEVENTCSRIIIINKGKIAADGKTKEVIAGAKEKRRLILEIGGTGVKDQIAKLAKQKNIKILEISSPQKKQTETGKNSAIKLTFELENKQEIRPEISNLARENNWIIWEIHQKEISLEDVFKKLTN